MCLLTCPLAYWHAYVCSCVVAHACRSASRPFPRSQLPHSHSNPSYSQSSRPRLLASHSWHQQSSHARSLSVLLRLPRSRPSSLTHPNVCQSNTTWEQGLANCMCTYACYVDVTDVYLYLYLSDINDSVRGDGYRPSGGNVGGGPLGALRPWQRSSPLARDGQVVVFGGGNGHQRPGGPVFGQSTKGPRMSFSCAKSNHLEVLALGVALGRVPIPSRPRVWHKCSGGSSHPRCQEVTGRDTSKVHAGAPDKTIKVSQESSRKARTERVGVRGSPWSDQGIARLVRNSPGPRLVGDGGEGRQTYIYIYICIERERDGERPGLRFKFSTLRFICLRTFLVGGTTAPFLSWGSVQNLASRARSTQ